MLRWNKASGVSNDLRPLAIRREQGRSLCADVAHGLTALLQQLNAMSAAFCCAHEGSQQDERVVIHSISGNVDVCPRCRRDAVERKVNTLLPRLLPLARRQVFFESCRLRIGHV